MLTALCRPHSGSVRGGGARRTATLALVAVWRPVRGERRAAGVAPRVRRTSADGARCGGDNTGTAAAVSNTGEVILLHCGVIMVPDASGDHRDIIGIRMTWITFIPSLFINLKLIIWRRAVQSIKQRDTKKEYL